MQTGRVMMLEPAGRTPWHVALVIATADVTRHLGLTLAVVAAGAVAAVVLVLLLLVAAPLGAAVVAWIVVRSMRAGRGWPPHPTLSPAVRGRGRPGR